MLILLFVKKCTFFTESSINAGYPVGIADIKYANGSDNALMVPLAKRDLLYRIKSYADRNIATNSTGFSLGTGLLARKMTNDAKDKLLTVRYLDDWAYQANVRTNVGNEIVRNFGNPKYYYQPGSRLSFAESRNTELMRAFAK